MSNLFYMIKKSRSTYFFNYSTHFARKVQRDQGIFCGLIELKVSFKYAPVFSRNISRNCQGRFKRNKKHAHQSSHVLTNPESADLNFGFSPLKIFNCDKNSQRNIQ